MPKHGQISGDHDLPAWYSCDPLLFQGFVVVKQVWPDALEVLDPGLRDSVVAPVANRRHGDLAQTGSGGCAA